MYWVSVVFSVYVLFFFKLKTAYEMRISDWSSDVCSSDLPKVDCGSPVTPVSACEPRRYRVPVRKPFRISGDNCECAGWIFEASGIAPSTPSACRRRSSVFAARTTAREHSTLCPRNHPIVQSWLAWALVSLPPTHQRRGSCLERV